MIKSCSVLGTVLGGSGARALKKTNKGPGFVELSFSVRTGRPSIPWCEAMEFTEKKTKNI